MNKRYEYQSRRLECVGMEDGEVRGGEGRGDEGELKEEGTHPNKENSCTII